jgi:hypothetical protein
MEFQYKPHSLHVVNAPVALYLKIIFLMQLQIPGQMHLSIKIAF